MMDLLYAEFKRTWIQLIRYPTEIISGIIITAAVFYGLFVSAQYIAGPGFAFGDRLDAVVVGYVVWTLILFINNDIAINLQLEAQTGTLEQIFLSPFGAPRVFFGQSHCQPGATAAVDSRHFVPTHGALWQSPGVSTLAAAAPGVPAASRLRSGLLNGGGGPCLQAGSAGAGYFSVSAAISAGSAFRGIYRSYAVCSIPVADDSQHRAAA